MPSITKRIDFSASHYYWNPSFSEEINHQVFGKCANQEGHGHNYQVEVTVDGVPDPVTGMAINFFDLTKVLDKVILGPLDHKNLNTQVDFFKTRIPTLENIALYLWEALHPVMTEYGLTLKTIKVIEQNDLYVEYDGVLKTCSV